MRLGRPCAVSPLPYRTTDEVRLEVVLLPLTGQEAQPPDLKGQAGEAEPHRTGHAA